MPTHRFPPRSLLLVSTIVLSAALFLPGCSGPCVKGDGPAERRSIAVEPFREVIFEGSMDLRISTGDVQSLEVEAPSAWADLLDTDVRDGVLTISTEQCHRGRAPFIVHLTTPAMDRIALRGSGDVEGTLPPGNGELVVELNGSGDMHLVVDAREVTASVRGSGDMVLEGRTDKLDAQLHGSGDIEAGGLVAEDVTAELRGSGDIVLHANGSLVARLTGSGDIRYSGNPREVDTHKKGSGEIKSVK